MATQTEMRAPAMIASALLIACQALLAGEPRSACDLLSATEISTITGEAMQAASHPTMRADHPACKFVGRRTTLLISVFESESPSAAAQAFAHELQKAPSSAQPDEPLLGVGVDARYRPSANEEGGTIVARFGTVVIVVSGDLERAALVQLARAATAHLSGTHASATHDGSARNSEDMRSGRQRAASL